MCVCVWGRGGGGGGGGGGMKTEEMNELENKKMVNKTTDKKVWGKRMNEKKK